MLTGNPTVKEVATKNHVIQYEMEPTSTISILWYKDKSLKIDIVNHIVFSMKSHTDDLEAAEALKEALYKDMQDYTFSRVIRYNGNEELGFFHQEIDKIMNDVNKSMVLYEQYLQKKFGYDLF